MSIAALITEGIGTGGSVTYLLTGGLGIGEAIVTVPTTGGPFRPRKKKHSKPEIPDWQKQRDRDKRLEDEVREIYALVVEGKRPERPVAQEIVAAVAPFVGEENPRPRKYSLPPIPTVDFSAIVADMSALGRLLEALGRTHAAEHARRIIEQQRIGAEIEADDMEVIEHLMAMGVL